MSDVVMCPVHDVSAHWAYAHHKCRCDVCKEFRAAYMRKYRARKDGRGQQATKVRSRAQVRAIQLFKDENPERWERLLDEEWAAIGGRRKRPNERTPE